MHPGSFLTLMVYCKLNKESSSEKFVNRLRFDRIMDTSLCLTFFGPPCMYPIAVCYVIIGARTTAATCCKLTALRDELARRVDACRPDPQLPTTSTHLQHPSVALHASNLPLQVRVGVSLY